MKFYGIVYGRVRLFYILFFIMKGKGNTNHFSCCRGIRAPSGVTEVPFGSLRSHIKTGDIVLLSGVSTSGSIIKFFTHSCYSHIAIVRDKSSSLYNIVYLSVPHMHTHAHQAICPKFTSEVFVLETTPNRRGKLII